MIQPPEHAESVKTPPPATVARLRGLYLLGLAALALPGALIGVPLGFALRPTWPASTVQLLALVAAGCALLGLWLAWRQSRSPEPGSLLSAAVLLASAPAVPLLMACLLWRRGDALALLLPQVALAFGVGWLRVRRWGKQQEANAAA